MQLSAQGYCCTQILLKIMLENAGIENFQLIRSVEGLCNGAGSPNNTCGVLTGGAMILGLYAGHEPQTEEKDERLFLLLDTFSNWFQEKIQASHGAKGTSCGDIVGEDFPPQAEKKMQCAVLITDTLSFLEDLLQENGYELLDMKTS